MVEVALIANEVVDIIKLRIYAIDGIDRMSDALKLSIQLHESHGGCPNGENAPHQRYAKQIIFGRATTRLYSTGVPMQTLTGEAMAESFAKGRMGVDISNWFPNCIYKNKDLCTLVEYAENTRSGGRRSLNITKAQ